MEAPDKIFCWRGVLGSLFCSPNKETNIGCTEYIRKDALLEWLNDEIERYNDKLIQSSNNKEKAIQIASSISSLLGVIAKLETL